MKNISKLLPVLLLQPLILAACNAETKESIPPPDKKKDPYSMLVFAPGVSADEFDRRFRNRLEKKFPHITLEYNAGGSANTITDLLSRGTVPDIMRVLNSQLYSGYLNLGLGYDLRELVKTNKYDLSRFEPIFIESLKKTGQSEALYGLPVPPYFVRVLYYNKDLFERFGVKFPQDGMEWDEVYALANQMSRVDGGTMYRGFSMNIGTLASYNEYSLSIHDPVKDGLSDSDTWKKILDNYIRFYKLPNNPISASSGVESNVFKDGNVAMSLNVFSPYVELGNVDWDMVAVPLIAGAPRQSGFFTPGNWMITNQSKHKEEAFEVIIEMLSDEVQMEDSRNGITTTLANNAIKQILGQGHPVLSKKNIHAVHYHKLAPLPPVRGPGVVPVDASIGSQLISQTFFKLAQEPLDVNSALRELDEKLKMEVEKAKNK